MVIKKKLPPVSKLFHLCLLWGFLHFCLKHIVLGACLIWNFLGLYVYKTNLHFISLHTNKKIGRAHV